MIESIQIKVGDKLITLKLEEAHELRRELNDLLGGKTSLLPERKDTYPAAPPIWYPDTVPGTAPQPWGPIYPGTGDPPPYWQNPVTCQAVADGVVGMSNITASNINPNPGFVTGGRSPG